MDRQLPRIIMHNDFGEDVDDPVSVAVAAELSRLGYIELMGITAGTDPVDARTTVGRGFMNRVGLKDVPIACGRGRQDEFWFESEQTPWAPPRNFSGAGRLLRETFLEADQEGIPNTLTIVICAPMRDYAEFLMNHPDLFYRNIAHVVIMGGVEMDGDTPKLDENGFMVPDTAKNNFVSPEAASYFYKELQKHGVKLSIVTRLAAYACIISQKEFGKFALTGNDAGNWLVSGLQNHFNSFWQNVHLPLGHPTRVSRKMPDRQNREFFINFILKGKGEDRTVNDTIHDLVEGVPVYDALALAAACPEFVEEFFNPTTVTIHGTNHTIIGLSRNDSSVKDPAKLSSYLVELVCSTLKRSALVRSFEPKVAIK